MNGHQIKTFVPREPPSAPPRHYLLGSNQEDGLEELNLQVMH